MDKVIYQHEDIDSANHRRRGRIQIGFSKIRLQRTSQDGKHVIELVTSWPEPFIVYEGTDEHETTQRYNEYLRIVRNHCYSIYIAGPKEASIDNLDYISRGGL